LNVHEATNPHETLKNIKEKNITFIPLGIEVSAGLSGNFLAFGFWRLCVECLI
jgi:hypothetical protein